MTFSNGFLSTFFAVNIASYPAVHFFFLQAKKAGTAGYEATVNKRAVLLLGHRTNCSVSWPSVPHEKYDAIKPNFRGEL